MSKIKTLTIAPLTKVNDWLIRVSITNSENIMVMAFGKRVEDFAVRFFTTPEQTRDFIESVAGKEKPLSSFFTPKADAPKDET